jgi:hypothetical protein
MGGAVHEVVLDNLREGWRCDANFANVLQGVYVL